MEILSALRGHVDLGAVERGEESVERSDLIDAFRAGFRRHYRGAEEESKGSGSWRAIREGHLLQRASWRAGAWLYDEIFPDHVVKGSLVEVYGFRARAQRIRMGLPEGSMASRKAEDDRYAFVVFQVGNHDPLSLLCDTPASEWVPFSELYLIEQATAQGVEDGCSSCGAESCSAEEHSGLPPDRALGVGPLRCGCCGAAWMGGRPCPA
jgi:hypothetical protein